MQIVAGANAHAQISISPSHHSAVTEAGLSFAKQASQNTTPPARCMAMVAFRQSAG
jgi:hypothetical protein